MNDFLKTQDEAIKKHNKSIKEIKKRNAKIFVMYDDEVIDYYYNPKLPCTCSAIFADTHREYCKRRVRPR